MRHIRRNKERKVKRRHPPCSLCEVESAQTLECLTCEGLLERGVCPQCKRRLADGSCPKGHDTSVFTTRFCGEHETQIRETMKAHVFGKHPVNIARAMVRALMGEEI